MKAEHTHQGCLLVRNPNKRQCRVYTLFKDENIRLVVPVKTIFNYSFFLNEMGNYSIRIFPLTSKINNFIF